MQLGLKLGCGPRTTRYNRFMQWRKAGVWDQLMDVMIAAHDGDVQVIDGNKGVQITVSVDLAAGLRPRSTSFSTRRASRGGLA